MGSCCSYVVDSDDEDEYRPVSSCSDSDSEEDERYVRLRVGPGEVYHVPIYYIRSHMGRFHCSK